MANYQNHLIDPTYFYDAIEEFAFDYDIYVLTGKTIDELGRRVNQYELKTIRGSLQSNGNQIDRSKSGSTNNKSYDFYCKSLYRIDINDVITYKDNYYIVNSVQDYDEWGVRSASLSLINLTTYRDLADYVKYIKGEKFV